MSDSNNIHFRRAKPSDLQGVSELLAPHILQQQLLPRSDLELRKLMELAYVAVDSERIVGFCAVEVYSRKLAELQGLAVTDGSQRQGIGRRLIELCVELAAANNVHELMAVTILEAISEGIGGLELTTDR